MNDHLILVISLLIACEQPGSGATVHVVGQLDDVNEITYADLFVMSYSKPPWASDHGETYATPWPLPEHDEVSTVLGDRTEAGHHLLDLTFTSGYTPIVITGGITFDGETYDWCHVLGWDDQWWYDDEENIAMAAKINQVASLSIEADLPEWGVARNYDADGTDGLPFCSILVVDASGIDN